jgi:hypothetical protein
MPFHRLGAGKYESLGKTYVAWDCVPPTAEELKGFARIFTLHGVTVEQPSG